MPELTKRARHLVQLLAEELDETGKPWVALMEGDGKTSKSWDWRVDLGEGEDEDWYVSNESVNRTDVIPIKRLKS